MESGHPRIIELFTPETWREEVGDAVRAVVPPRAIKHLKRVRGEDMFRDTLDYLTEAYSAAGECFGDEAHAGLIDRVLGNFESFRSYHGCRPLSLDSYFREGLQPLSRARLAAIAFDLFEGTVPRAEIDTLSQRANLNTRLGHIYFVADRDELLRHCGHYLIYGPEALCCLWRDEHDRATPRFRESQERHRSRGVSEWAHANIPHLWPAGLRKDLCDPNSHLDTVCEVWWLSHVVGADFNSAEHGVPIDPTNPVGKNFDWRVRLPAAGVTLNLEVKRRPGDVGRSIDVPQLKWKSIFNDVDKFPDPAPPDRLNVGCIRLFAPISREVHHAAREWLAITPRVSALVFHALSRTDHESFAVITQPGLGYIELLFSPPDHEDNTYIAPFWFARDVPGLPLP
jgi:hypothetical protein